LANWIKKKFPTNCCLQVTHFIERNKHWLRVKDWEKIHQDNHRQKQAGIAILILDKVDFKLTLIKRDKEGHCILIRCKIHQKEITIMNLHPLNVNVPSFIKHTLKDLKTNINSNTVVVGDFNTIYQQYIVCPNQKTNKEIVELNHTIDQMDLVDV
jgi:endonuclease/exonuclease/phosphatase (EEP) superfamily protein YafD